MRTTSHKASEAMRKLSATGDKPVKSVADVLKKLSTKKSKTKGKKRKLDSSMRALLAKANKTETNHDSMLEIARNALDATGKMEIEKRVKFGGKVVTLTTHVDKTSVEAEAERVRELEKQNKSSLDDFVDKIEKKNQVSAVEKSSFDWEKYKQDKGLHEELQNARHEGVVDKEDFLHRVDHRKFEIERGERDLKRAAEDAKRARN